MQRLTPGLPMFPLNAATWNRFVDTAEYHKRNIELGDPKGGHVSRIFTDLLDIKNNTGGNRREGDVVEIGAQVLNDLTNAHPWFGGETPDETRCYGILRKPVKSGKIAPCQVSGVVKAYVNVTDAAHNFAIVEENSYVLKSAKQGAVRIVAKPAGTGELECEVLLGVPYEVFMGSAELAGDMCEETNPTLQNFVGWKAGPCVLMPDPLPSSAVNQFKHMGMAGDEVLIAYNTDPEVDDWVVIGVTKHVEALPVRLAFEDGCWVYYTKNFAMEKCSDDETREEYKCGRAC